MRNILVPLEPDGGSDATLAAAWAFGRQYGSYVEGLSLAPPPAAVVVADVPIGSNEFDARVRAETEAKARALFDRFVAGRAAAGDDGVTHGWSASQTIADIGGYARVFDLTVVGRPAGDTGDPRRATLEAVLFESGRAILIVPPGPVATIGGTILIAWNRATETARTVALAKPLLRRAERVYVFDVPMRTAGPSAAVLAQALARDGISIEEIVPDDLSGAAGPLILREAGRLGVDLLIKGGYTQSRLRQLIFGGATSHILSAAQLPVFMAH